MRLVGTILICALALPAVFGRTVEHINNAGHDIWISPLTNAQGAQLAPGIVKLAPGAKFTYKIPDGGWGGRFWPKWGCDGGGQNCHIGQSMPPCGANGCSPPADTKVEFFFPPLGNGENVWYDISLVDGYSLGCKIEGACGTTNCHVSTNSCPKNDHDVGNLNINNGAQCMSPCKKWNYPPPYGLGNSEQTGHGLTYCCPTPPVTPEQCRNGAVVNTDYVKLIHKDCPTAYSYAYDDKAGLHNCGNKESFKVTWLK